MCFWPHLGTPESVSSRTVPINSHSISNSDNFFTPKLETPCPIPVVLKLKDRIQESLKLWMEEK